MSSLVREIGAFVLVTDCGCILFNYAWVQMHPLANETPTVRGLAADNNNKLCTEAMIFLWNNHYNLNFIM